ncbi:MAG TPA: pYEATS domain-containing protein [Chitinophagales bacterium]|nr:pYEATS domain-containing protein [Chitinophagales bacterium]
MRTAVTENWEANSAIEFTDWFAAYNKDAAIHIFISDEEPHTDGLGTDLKEKDARMVLNFTFQNWGQNCQGNIDYCIKAIAVHEFGHAIGFAHEQNRKDCAFINCKAEKQGDDGDIYMPCDAHSVMNYCNPQYNNNGVLSEGDIKAVQAIYGNIAKKEDYESVDLFYTSNKLHKCLINDCVWHSFQLYISAGVKDFIKIDSVIYHLHPTFPNQDIIITNSETNFGLGLKAYDDEFSVTAYVYFKNRDKPKKIRRCLHFNENVKTAYDCDKEFKEQVDDAKADEKYLTR